MRRLFVFFAAFTNICLAQTSPSIVNTVSGPIQVVSTVARPNDMISEMSIRNSSSLKISQIRIGLIISIPLGCGEIEYTSREHTRSMSVDLSPNATVTLKDIHVSPKAMAKLQRSRRATSLVSQIAIVGATYSDGSTWALARNGKSYNDEKLQKEASLRCITNKSKLSIADSTSCGPGKLVLAGQSTGYNGQYYTCVASADQYCTNNVSSCTNTACPTAAGCPAQMCQLNQATGSGTGSPSGPKLDEDPDDPCDDGSLYCGGDDGDDGDGQGMIRTPVSSPSVGA